MTIAEALKNAGIDAIDAELLLADALAVPRTVLLARAHEAFSEGVNERFQEQCARRKKGEPLAYIRSKQEFYGRTFFVDPSVLIPRPATEGLLDLTVSSIASLTPHQKEIDAGVLGASWILKKKPPTTIVDIGTGSGAIAVTLARLLPSMKIIATDTSVDALQVAVRNAWTEGAMLDVRVGSLLEPVMDLSEPFFVVSNPPYIPEGETLMKDVFDFEPHEALFAGKDGLSVIRPLIEQCKKHPFCTGLALEFRKDQKDTIDSFF